MRSTHAFSLTLLFVACFGLIGCGGQSQVSAPGPLVVTTLTGLSADSIVYSPSRRNLYASTDSGIVAMPFGGATRSYLTGSGTSTSFGIPGAHASSLSISGNDDYLFAFSVPTVDLIPFANPAVPIIATVPGDPAWQISSLKGSSTAYVLSDGNAVLYNGQTVVGQSKILEQDTTLDNSTGQLLSFGGSNGAYAVAPVSLSAGVGASTVLAVTPKENPANESWIATDTFNAPMVLTKTRAVTCYGGVLDPASGTLIAQLSFPSGTVPIFAVSVPGTDDVYFVYGPPGGVSSSGYGILHYNAASIQLIGTPQVMNTPFSGYPSLGVWSGDGRLTLLTTGGTVLFATNLP